MPEAPAPGRGHLLAGLEALSLDAAIAAPLLAYRDELVRWNRVHNLSGVRDPGEMVPLHLLDSLALLPLLQGHRVMDIGSGGGLPGIPLAIASPERAFVLVEPRAKRALFLEHVVRLLELENVKVERCRAEALPTDRQQDTVVTRAFGTLAAFIAAAGLLCAPDGILLAAKGKEPGAELAALPAGWEAQVVALAVPGLDSERHAVRLMPPDNRRSGPWAGS